MTKRRKQPAAWTVEEIRAMREKFEGEQLRHAIDVSGLSARKFAEAVDVDERTVRYWLADQRGIPGPVMSLCLAIVRDPSLATYLLGDE